MVKIEAIKKAFFADMKKAADGDSLEGVRVKYLGRKGSLNDIFGSLKNIPLAKRKVVAQQAQRLKREIETAIQEPNSKFQIPNSDLRIDLTAPGKKLQRGHLHPLTLVLRDIKNIFLSMGFSVVDGPEIESEYYNFDALNIPPDHPARDAWDTFWLRGNQKKVHGSRFKVQKEKSNHEPRTENLLLRTHTSPVQIRYMEQHNPPFQVIVPGRVFRYEATDASHEVNFHQLEGLMVGKDVTLANFKFVVEEFFKRFFRGQKINFRYRPSYFPFVEPGIEVDIRISPKSQILNSKFSGWTEVMGAGMVHPHVFEYAHYNPRDLRGFAFGMGIDRLAMIKYKIPDIRMFYSGDLRIIKQF